jgi:hypothetical protein
MTRIYKIMRREFGGWSECADEFDVKAEAVEMMAEYRLSDRAGVYWMKVERAMTKPTEDQFRNAAQRLHHDEGTLEIDDTAPVSSSEHDQSGAYVQAWIWITSEEASPAK